MQYRQFGRSGLQVSALGFGCMRFPTGEGGRIKEDEATCMVRYAIDQGVNYLDSGYGYHGGQSEPFLGRALSDGYRGRVILATKLLLRAVDKPADCDRLLNEQLERLQTERIDVYLLHGVRRHRWERRVLPFGVLDFLDRALADGRIGMAGFSFHDNYALFREIVDAYANWGMCQIQYNYMNEQFQAGRRGLQYAASKGLAVAVMEPLLGGRLAMPPKDVQAIWDSASSPRWDS